MPIVPRNLYINYELNNNLRQGPATYTFISTVHKYQRFSVDPAAAVGSLVVRVLGY